MTSSFLVGDPGNVTASTGSATGSFGHRTPAPAPTRLDALPPGTRLDEYEIGPLLGASALGLVYLATDHSLGRKVAIREYLPSALSGRGDGAVVALRSVGMGEAYRRGLAAFVEEARLLARFDDPSLVRVLRFWEAHFTAYIVMPYYDGPALTEARERLDAPPAEPWIRSLLESLSSTLELLHEASCLHRNVTPDRVLMLRDGRPMLLGPSAVRQVLGREAHITPVRPGFSAIEDYAESSDLPRGPWTDVYALGALARFCILGIAPVAAPVRSVRDPLIGMQDALIPMRVQGPTLSYSPELLNAIDRALAVDPARRPQSMAEFRELLRIAPPTSAIWTASSPNEAVFDPTRPEPDLSLLSATDLETDAFEASLSAMLDEALIDAPPMRHAAGDSTPPVSGAPAPPWPATNESSVVRAALADTALLQGRESAARRGRDPTHEPVLAADPHAEPGFGDALASPEPALSDAARDPGFGGSGPDTPFVPFAAGRRPPWQRRLTAVAAVLLLGAFGYVGWSQYLRLQDEDRLAARVPTTALPSIQADAQPSATPASASDAADPTAAARLNPPAAGIGATTGTGTGTGAGTDSGAASTPATPPTAAPSASEPDTATGSSSSNLAPPGTKQTGTGGDSAAPSSTGNAKASTSAPSSTPVDSASGAPEAPSEPPAPVRSARLARAALHEARASRLPAEPREVCGARTDFALYRCMQTQCDKPQYVGHSQCRQFKLQDRVE